MPNSIQNVAILSDFVYHDYPAQLLAGIRSILEPRQLATTVYLGGHLRDAGHPYRKANDIYGLLHPEQHAGVIVFTQTLFREQSDEQVQNFLRTYHPLPIISVGRALPGVPSVLIDNHAGMRSLMQHLLVARGFRRFVFVRGTPGNADSELRERVFRESLAQQRLHPQAILTGHYDPQQVHDEVIRHLQTQRAPDVIVCANDDMAEGAMRALRHQGLRVQDIAVVGFDDASHAHLTVPPLTTVRQPVYEQGQAAARTLLQLLGQQRAAPETHLETRLVIRQSCGTPPRPGSDDGAEDNPGQHFPAHFPPEHQQVLTSFQEALHDENARDRFLTLFRTLVMSRAQQAKLGSWSDFLQHVRQTQRPALPQSAKIFDELHAQALSALNHALLSVVTNGHSKEARRAYLISQLSAADTQDTLHKGIREYLAHLELHRAALVLYEHPTPHIPQRAQVFVAQGFNTGDGAPDSASFDPARLLPDTLRPELRHGHWMIAPLYTGEQHYGYLLYQRPDQGYVEDETPLQTISHALLHYHERQAVQQYAQQLKQHSETLEQQVRTRTQQLEGEIQERKKVEKALRIANDDLRRSVYLDGLTGIYNRGAFDEFMARLWADHQRRPRPLSLLLCDVDFFKKYNDHYGHLRGDQCLKSVATALESCIREQGDVVARYGGEEFAVILAGTAEEGARQVADRIQEAVQQLQLLHERSEVSAYVTVSIGAATVIPAAGSFPEQLIEQADQLLYAAKKAGRSRVVSSI